MEVVIIRAKGFEYLGNRWGAGEVEGSVDGTPFRAHIDEEGRGNDDNSWVEPPLAHVREIKEAALDWMAEHAENHSNAANDAVIIDGWYQLPA